MSNWWGGTDYAKNIRRAPTLNGAKSILGRLDAKVKNMAYWPALQESWTRDLEEAKAAFEASWGVAYEEEFQTDAKSRRLATSAGYSDTRTYRCGKEERKVA